MTRRGRALAAVPLSALLLAGCASSGQDEVHDWVGAVTEAANDRDAPALRASVDELLATLDAQVRAGELTSAEADRIAEAARSVQARADLVDQELLDQQAEQEAAEEAARLEAERLAAEEAARKAAEEEAAKQAEEAAKKAEEEAKKDEEKKKDKDDDDDEEGDG